MSPLGQVLAAHTLILLEQLLLTQIFFSSGQLLDSVVWFLGQLLHTAVSCLGQFWLSPVFSLGDLQVHIFFPR